MKVATSSVVLLFAAHAPLTSTGKEEWLKAHNDRRLKYHTSLNSKEVVNLKWSTGLTEKAKEWAEGNVAMNRKGSDDGYGWSSFKKQDLWTAEINKELVLKNWESKISLGYPSNGAFTQAIWRPTEYVGCYIARSTDPAKLCQCAVCYYAKAGNCAMAGAKGTTPEAIAAWEDKVYADDSDCGPECSPELPYC
jgi:hypothetical protein